MSLPNMIRDYPSFAAVFQLSEDFVHKNRIRRAAAKHGAKTVMNIVKSMMGFGRGDNVGGGNVYVFNNYF